MGPSPRTSVPTSFRGGSTLLLSGRAQRLINLLKWCADHWQLTFPKQKWLAEKLDCSVRTVKRALAEICGEWVQVKRRYRRSNVYRILEAVTDQQIGLFATEEKSEEISTPKHAVPIVGPTVVVRNPKPSEAIYFSSRERRQHHPDDAERIRESELQRAAGIEGKLSPGDRAFLGALQQPPEVIRAGILLGRARKLAQRAQTGRNEPIRSLRYFAGSIAEVGRDLPPGLRTWYPGRLEALILEFESKLA